jgi:hypothetical protein
MSPATSGLTGVAVALLSLGSTSLKTAAAAITGSAAEAAAPKTTEVSFRMTISLSEELLEICPHLENDPSGSRARAHNTACDRAFRAI